MKAIVQILVDVVGGCSITQHIQLYTGDVIMRRQEMITSLKLFCGAANNTSRFKSLDV